MAEPILYGTQKDYAWSAFQEIAGPYADRAHFEAWWQGVLESRALPTDVRDILLGAWLEGARALPQFTTWYKTKQADQHGELTVTEDEAWAAYQTIAGQAIDKSKFDVWWKQVTTSGVLRKSSTRDILLGAWLAGWEELAQFGPWYKVNVLDCQPVVTEVEIKPDGSEVEVASDKTLTPDPVGATNKP